MDPLIGIRDKLVVAGVGHWQNVPTNGWTIVIGRLPATPDQAVGIVGTGGPPPNPKFLLDYPTLQVLIRGGEQGYVAARGKIQLVKDTLLGLPSQDVNGDRWVQINMVGDINPLGYDEKNRPLFSANFQMIILPASSAQSNRISL